jgi:hypothetical protein
MNHALYDKLAARMSGFNSATQTFPEVLSDPLVRALMAADGIDPAALEADLRKIAANLPPIASTSRNCCGGFR